MRAARTLQLIFAGFFVAACAGTTGYFVLRSTYEQAAHEVCDLVGHEYYLADEPEVQKFVSDCHESASAQTFLVSKADNIRRINRRLSAVNTSHLSLYRPDENQAIWENKSLDTGLRAHIVESDLIVYRVVEGSAAEKAGMEPGDAILSINNEEVSSAWDAQTLGGKFSFVRRGKIKSVEITPTELTEDMGPRFYSTGRAGILVLPSFLPQYYDEERWLPIAKELLKYKQIVIDLRDNSGGSFPAMLRTLSSFRCEQTIGQLFGAKIRGHEKNEIDLLDDLDTQSQLRQLESAERVLLRTFRGYPCYEGDVTVLIDSGTSSTAEIFAEAFFARAHSRVWGQPSAGQVVMARWFPVKNFGGDDTSLAIPIAGYVSESGSTIEKLGLQPKKLLYYELEAGGAGRDSWLESAL